MLCRHCGPTTGKQIKRGARGLCYVCYNDLSIRNQYPPQLRPRCVRCDFETRPGEERAGLCSDCFEGRPPKVLPPADPAPTNVPPWSEDYLAVMAARAQRELPTIHPLDGRAAS